MAVNKAKNGQVLLELLVLMPVISSVFLGIYMMLALQAKLWLKHYAYEYAICVHYQLPACKQNNIYIIRKLFPFLKNVKASADRSGNKTVTQISAEYPNMVEFFLRTNTQLAGTRYFRKTIIEKGVFGE